MTYSMQNHSKCNKINRVTDRAGRVILAIHITSYNQYIPTVIIVIMKILWQPLNGRYYVTV